MNQFCYKFKMKNNKTKKQKRSNFGDENNRCVKICHY